MLDRSTKLQGVPDLYRRQWTDAVSGKTFQSYDPYTGAPWALIPECDKADVDRAVDAASPRLRERRLAEDDANGARQDHAPDRRA